MLCLLGCLGVFVVVLCLYRNRFLASWARFVDSKFASDFMQELKEEGRAFPSRNEMEQARFGVAHYQVLSHEYVMPRNQ